MKMKEKEGEQNRKDNMIMEEVHGEKRKMRKRMPGSTAAGIWRVYKKSTCDIVIIKGAGDKMMKKRVFVTQFSIKHVN